MKIAPNFKTLTDLSMDLPAYAFDGGEDWIKSITHVTANGIPLAGIHAKDLNDIKFNEVGAEKPDYLIFPLPKDTEETSIDADNIIAFYLFQAGKDVIKGDITPVEFIVKADGYSDVTFNFTIKK
ncbi:hypothetical protein [Cytobacillus gottheilii]|uniref:hypothetical protein n=1 Tax=Cytobacillus gottheilii TaxID=859144 RepID=UPI000832B49F|nr:hypothetical protein [Cytobacillus gottheilii]